MSVSTRISNSYFIDNLVESVPKLKVFTFNTEIEGIPGTSNFCIYASMNRHDYDYGNFKICHHIKGNVFSVLETIDEDTRKRHVDRKSMKDVVEFFKNYFPPPLSPFRNIFLPPS